MQNNLNRLVGRHIRTQREYKHLTREKLSEQADISVRFLDDIEGGKKGMSVHTLSKIASALDTSIDSLLLKNNYDNNTTIFQLPKSISEKDLEVAEQILRAFVNAVTKQR